MRLRPKFNNWPDCIFAALLTSFYLWVIVLFFVAITAKGPN